MKIIIVDNNDTFRFCLKKILIQKNSAEIIGEASNGIDFKNLTNKFSAEIILLDLELKDTNVIALTKQTLSVYPFLKFIGFTTNSDQFKLTEIIEAGFKGCLLKNHPFADLSNAIEKVSSGHYYFSKHIIQNIHSSKVISHSNN